MLPRQTKNKTIDPRMVDSTLHQYFFFGFVPGRITNSALFTQVKRTMFLTGHLGVGGKGRGREKG